MLSCLADIFNSLHSSISIEDKATKLIHNIRNSLYSSARSGLNIGKAYRSDVVNEQSGRVLATAYRGTLNSDIEYSLNLNAILDLAELSEDSIKIRIGSTYYGYKFSTLSLSEIKKLYLYMNKIKSKDKDNYYKLLYSY